MLRIEKDGKVMEVTKTVYDNYYSSAGWNVIGGTPSKNKVVEEKVLNGDELEPVDNSDEDFSDEEWDAVESAEKSVSEMNGDELRQYAKVLGIDISGLNSNRKIRDAINNSLR